MIALNDITAIVRKIEDVDHAVVQVSGSKHVFVYSFLFALLSNNEKVVFDNVPNISDTDFIIEYARKAGAIILYDKDNGHLEIQRGIQKNIVWTPFVVNCRSSLIAITVHALLFSKCCITNSLGGCRIGERKIDQHVKLWNELGGNVSIEELITLDIDDPKCCEDFILDMDTTMGTVSALFALSQGRLLKVTGPSQRPEIICLVEFMNALGYPIKYHTRERCYVMDGIIQKADFVRYNIPDDIDECLGWACFCHVNNISAKIMADVPYIESIKFLERISNGDIAWERGMLIVSPTPEKAKNLNCDIIASEFPNIGSDQQPIFSVWAALLCESVWVEDKKFRNRFSYLEQLNKFGWKSEVLNDRRKITFQPVQFNEVEFVATDLRAAFAFIVAGTFLTNKFEVTHYEQLLRGYADINQKLRFLGFEVTIVERMSHGSVAILISNENNELYLQKRDLRTPKNPGKVSLFGGAIEEGESPYEAAQRELQEELGLLSPMNYINSFNLNQANYSISGTVHLFYLKAPRSDLTCQEGILIQRTVEQALKENLTVFARTVLETWGN